MNKILFALAFVSTSVWATESISNDVFCKDARNDVGDNGTLVSISANDINGQATATVSWVTIGENDQRISKNYVVTENFQPTKRIYNGSDFKLVIDLQTADASSNYTATLDRKLLSWMTHTPLICQVNQ